MKLLKHLLFFSVFAVSSAQASIIDFTSNGWSGVGQNSINEFTFDGIRLSSVGGNLTFNDPDGASGWPWSFFQRHHLKYAPTDGGRLFFIPGLVCYHWRIPCAQVE